MDVLLKAFRRSPADAHGRAIGRAQTRMLFFEFLQPRHQRVVFLVGDFRSIVNVVKLFVVANLVAELLDLFAQAGGLGRGFRHLSSSRLLLSSSCGRRI